MKLFIDTSSSEKVILKLDDQIYETDARQDKSQRLLPFIEEVLSTNNKTLKDLTAIEVVTGPGSFTGLRVGVSVAQTLGLGLSIPVNGQDMKTSKFIDINYGS